MEENNKRFSFVGLIVKLIMVVVFILFTAWLLSLSNKGLTDSLNVLTDDIFSENIERMKNVGKEYFTTERLPKDVGDIKVISLEKMYDLKLLLELKDKKGKACSAKNSYVSVEKLENEYQMKVYLDCDDDSDYVIVIMGCYDYCDTDICEVKQKNIEYQYSLTTGGKWSDYGAWSEWSKNIVSRTDYRDIETKIVKENYSYDKKITENDYKDLVIGCATGYTLSSDKTKCVKDTSVIQNVNPVCPAKDGYTVTRSGFTCTYGATSSSTASPICPTVSGYSYSSKSGFTCYYTKTTSKSSWAYQYTTSGSYVPGNTSTYKYVQTSADYVYSCTTTCSARWVYTYQVYKLVYSYSTASTTSTAYCPSGYSPSGSTCIKYTTSTLTGNATCPSGYNKNGNVCSKTVSTPSYSDIITSCPVEYNKTSDGSRCFKVIESTVTVTGTRDVTYCRYRTRTYSGGTTVYKWSCSNNDRTLLDAGYRLTGVTR